MRRDGHGGQGGDKATQAYVASWRKTENLLFDVFKKGSSFLNQNLN